MNEHILNAMTMIASVHRDLHFKHPLTSGDVDRAKRKLVVALGDLAFFSSQKWQPMAPASVEDYDSFGHDPTDAEQREWAAEGTYQDRLAEQTYDDMQREAARWPQ